MVQNIPIYIQIHDKIKEDIEKGVWSIGDRLPSERELALKFDVSRMTLRRHPDFSRRRDFRTKIGSGTYVARKKVQETMTGTTSFTEITLSQNRVPSSRTVSYFVAKPSSSEMEKLQLGPEDSILRMERIRFADDIPICFEVASIPYSLVSQYGKSEITNSFIKHLKPNHKIGHSNQTISAVQASEQIAEYLEIKRGDAILRVRQVSYFENGLPFEYVRTQYAGSRFEFYLEK